MRSITSCASPFSPLSSSFTLPVFLPAPPARLHPLRAGQQGERTALRALRGVVAHGQLQGRGQQPRGVERVGLQGLRLEPGLDGGGVLILNLMWHLM